MKAEGSLRILLTADAIGGVWQYSLDLAHALGARGVETVIAVLGPSPSPQQAADADAIPGAKLIDTGLPLDWMADDAAQVRSAGRAIAELARAERCDLIQLNMPTLAAGAAPCATVPMLAVTHGCVSTWWQAAQPEVPLGDGYRWHRALMAEGLGASDRVVAPTAAYAAMVAEHYELPRAPQVVHNGRRFPVPARQAAPASRVFTAGRLWDRVKGAALLDRVAAGLEIPFEAAGSSRGPHGEWVDLPHLRLLGTLGAADFNARLADRPIFVSAASFEPFGLAVLEAAMMGCALVLSDIPGFRELWDGAALFVESHDVPGYRAAIETLIADPALRLRLGEQARTRASRYTPDATADAMLAHYRHLLAGTATGRRAA